jgi:hypothetical protein
MNRYLPHALIVVLLAVLAGAILGMRVRKEPRPSYLHKPFRFWVRSLSPGISVEGGFESLEFVVNTNAPQYDWHMKWETDTNALPVFIGALGVHEGPVRKALCRLWAKLPDRIKWRVPVPFNAEQVRAKAVQAIGRMGEGYAKPAIPALITVLRKDESPLVREFAVNALARLSQFRLDRDVMDAWVQAAHDEDPRVRWFAAQILKREAPALAAQAGVK